MYFIYKKNEWYILCKEKFSEKLDILDIFDILDIKVQESINYRIFMGKGHYTKKSLSKTLRLLKIILLQYF